MSTSSENEPSPIIPETTHRPEITFAQPNYEEIFPDDSDLLDDSYPNEGRTRERDLGTGRMLGYAVGHFFNDLCASMWFTYLMIYLENVIQMHSYKAGMLMLIGQVTDAICTPLVGLLSDVSCLPWWMLEKFGRRISWHMIGTFCVALSFPFIFADCLFCQPSTHEWLRTLWFIPFIMVFQFGWASVQISHLALIPELSSVESSRTSMNSFRYGFTVLANLVVFAFLYVFLNRSNVNDKIGPSDSIHFRDMGFIVVGLGLFMDTVFYFTTREPKDGRRLSRLNSISSETSHLVRMTWRDWFSQVPFYQVCFGVLAKIL
uniref:Major facilitator superfamily domain-containing protein 12 n=1 Tax=Acrobeloides nanus TaxID=290746 RepID=A0A914EFH2_9BILA